MKSLARRLVDKFERLDVLVLNAGMGGFAGVDWPAAIWELLTDFFVCVTWPTFKIGVVGRVVGPQARPQRNCGVMKSEKDVAVTEAQGTQHMPAPEPALGEIFCANVFGHYILAHDLSVLLRRRNSSANGSARHTGRIIWTSSLEAYSHAFSIEDFQGLTTPLAYESSKRLTDLLVLTADLPAAAPWVKEYFVESMAAKPVVSADAEGQANGRRDKKMQIAHGEATTSHQMPALSTRSIHISEDELSTRPTIHVSHPGISQTSIMPLNFLASFAMLAALHLARLLGSIWHPIYSYKGACAPVWLTLLTGSALHSIDGAALEDKDHVSATSGATASTVRRRGGNNERSDIALRRHAEGKGKWGTATDVWGNERVERTEVEGWGWTGIPVEATTSDAEQPSTADGKVLSRRKERRKGRRRGAQDLTPGARMEFEELGATCWKEMERLRILWEGILAGEDC